jgi:hypothetical protein
MAAPASTHLMYSSAMSPVFSRVGFGQWGFDG